MSAQAFQARDASEADEFDVIAACQLWLELDFPDQPATDPSRDAPTEKGSLMMTAVPEWTLDDIGNLPPVLDLPEAAQLLRIGRTSAYALAKCGQFPVPVVRAGKLYRVPTAGLLELLGLAVPPPPERVEAPHHFPAPACIPATSRASIHATS